MIKYVIHAKKWIDKINGNTYHSVRILNTQNNALIAAPFKYGSCDMFIQSARLLMYKYGWIEQEHFTPENYLETYIISENDCKKSEVLKWGEAA
jgi:hypothetical protein